MRTYDDIARQILTMQPGQWLDVPFADVPQMPDFLCRNGRSPVDEILCLVPLAGFRIIPCVVSAEGLYRFKYLPEDRFLDVEGDVMTWVYYDRRQYFSQRPDGLWYKNHTATQARHERVIAEHLANR